MANEGKLGKFLKSFRLGTENGKGPMEGFKRLDRAALKQNPVGGYASIDPAGIRRDFNLSGFQRGTKLPTK